MSDTIPELHYLYDKVQTDAAIAAAIGSIEHPEAGGGGGEVSVVPEVDLTAATSYVYDFADVTDGAYAAGSYTDGFDFTVEAGTLNVLDGAAWFTTTGTLAITLPSAVTIPTGAGASRFSVDLERPELADSSARVKFRLLKSATSFDGIFLQATTNGFLMQPVPGDNATAATLFPRVTGTGAERTKFYYISLPQNAIVGTDTGARGVFGPRTLPESSGSSNLNTIKVISESFSGPPLKMFSLRVDKNIEVTNSDAFPATAVGTTNPFWPTKFSALELRVPFLAGVDNIPGVILDNQGNITFGKALGAFCSITAAAGATFFVVSYNASNADTMVVGAKMYNRYGDFLGDVTGVTGSGSTRTISVASLLLTVPSGENVYFRPTPTILNSVDVGAKLSRSLTVAGTVRPSQSITGSRPSAVTSGAGAMHYDTTLVKPIWSDGTVWRDSAGTAV